MGVSRSAVWKCINALRDEGYEISSSTRRGYMLGKSPDRLTTAGIRAGLNTNLPEGEVLVFDSIDSTNEEGKRRALDGAPGDSIYIAEEQTSGKGRRGRVWSSPKGQDLFFSLLYYPDLEVFKLPMLTLIAALAAAETASEWAGEKVFIKWPNDLVLHGKKICGILTEMGAEPDRISYVVIGLGFNLNRMTFEKEIEDMASSIRKETGKTVDRTKFFCTFYRRFREKYRQFLKDEDLAFMMKDYNDLLINAGRELKVITKDGEKTCRGVGVNKNGELIVEDENGRKEYIFSGEVSVRGVYGYV